MNNQQVQLSGVSDHLQFAATTKLLCKKQNVTANMSKPQKRYGHLSFIYKSKLYVIGGCLANSKNQSLTNSNCKSAIYCYSLEKQRVLSVDDKKHKKPLEHGDVKWELLNAKFTPQAEAEFNLLSYCAYCVFPYKKRLYVFGGSTQQGKTSSHLFRLDLDSLEWSKPQQKGTVPKPREQANLSLYTKNQKNYLVLYGGANYQNYEIHTDINFYQIETKYWFQCHNLSINFIQPRISPGVCFDDNKIYVFGGYYMDAHQNKGYLNDLYEIEFNLTLQKGRPYGRSFARRLDQINNFYKQNSQGKPKKRCSAQLMVYKPSFNQLSTIIDSKKTPKPESSWLLLVGGQESCNQKKKTITTLNDIWLFSLEELKWMNFHCNNEFKPRSSFTAVIDKEINKVFVFGGLSSQDVILGDLVSIKISGKLREIKDEEAEEKFEGQLYENFQEGLSLHASLIQEICDTISFPYSAFSLIIDNFVNFQAEFCDISYHISKSKNNSHNYIKFQSNARIAMSSQTILSHFTCLKGGIRTYVQGTDKKIKAEMNRDNSLKEIGTNFVIGGLRLGGQIIFINLDSETFEIQIIIVLKCNYKPENEKKGIFQSKVSYILSQFIISREQILSQDVFQYKKKTEQSHKRRQFFQNTCPEQSRERIRILCLQGINSIRKGVIKNAFYISKLKTIDGQECSPETAETQLQLFPDMMKNDIIFGDRKLIQEIEVLKIPIYQCMDVSLHTYLGYLYTQLCQTEITLSIQGLERKRVMLQAYLLKFDDLVKSKDIIQISSEFEFDCKIVELYHLADKQGQKNPFPPTSKNDNSFFGHGTLYYHKNRLIKRHKINLGDFLFEYKLRKIIEKSAEKQSIILKPSHQYSASEIFGHIEVPQAVPVNLTKTDFVFPMMLEKIDQKLRLMEDQRIKQKKKIVKLKTQNL